MNITQITDTVYRNNEVEIKLDYKTQEVVVVENKKEIFRRLRNEQNISLAFSIYMGAKYKEKEYENE